MANELPTCCGIECVTAFCPHCGKCIASDEPLIALIAYCRKQAKKERSAADRKEEEGKARGSIGWPRTVESHRKTAEKWQTWADAVANAMQGKDGRDGE